jgi:hypothetical protein
MLDSPIQEIVRMIMLLYLTKMVKIPGRSIPYGWMGKQMRTAYEKVAEGPFEEDKTLCLWAIMVAASSISSSQTEWLRNAWSRVGTGLDWLDIRQHAVSVMWIGVLFDQPAQTAYQSLVELNST